MVFSSSIFIFAFLPVLLAVFFLVPKRFRNAVLLVFSLFFYAWGEPVYILLMILSITVNYLAGRIIGRDGAKERLRRGVLIADIVFNLGMLFIFKYLDFAISILNHTGAFHLPYKKIALPIGISFFTFQILSYVIDVYRRQVEPQKSLADLALYVALFPQLIAGPIVRYADVAREIREREYTWQDRYEGIRRFALGFGKKILLADQLANLADVAFSDRFPSLPLKWLGAIAYTLQIYYDFSGYSDMAIGLGRIFGFHFLENFNYPYISRSIQEFWRRWHISLSSWFRDYVYIPLGGNRKGPVRTYMNLIIVFFLTGLWHGASWNFIVWGMYYAVFLVAERLGFSRTLEKVPSFIRRIYVLLVVTIGWVFFRASDLTHALDYLRGMFVPSGDDLYGLVRNFDLQYLTCILLGIWFAAPHPLPEAITRRFRPGTLEAIRSAAILILFIAALSYLVGSGFSPFLYFRF